MGASFRLFRYLENHAGVLLVSTIRNAGQVPVLHNRKIIERGSHAELIEKGGFNSRLYLLQFEKPEITENMTI